MAPIKFEEQLKDKLEKRTLSPSADSWSKLSERLDAEDKKSKSPLYWWLGIAAGIVIMIAVSIQFFKSGDAERVMPQIVEEPLENHQIDKKKIKELEPQQIDKQVIELANESNEVENTEETLESVDEPLILDYKKTTSKTPKSRTRVAENSATKTEPQKLSETKVRDKVQPITFDETEVKEAVASAMKELKSNEISVTTDREVDSLLKLASKELFKDKLQKETAKTVDANALLMSVEDEMGESFRSKVFEALKNSYESVKTAVAERNN